MNLDSVLLETLFSSSVGVAVFGLDLRVTRVNAARAALAQREPAQWIGESVQTLFGVSADRLEDALQRASDSAEPILNLKFTALGSGLAWLEHVYPLRDALGQLCGVALIAAEPMGAAEHLAQRWLERSSHAFCVIELQYDAEGKPIDYVFLQTNQMFEHHTGLVNAVGRSALELVPQLEQFWIEAYAGVAESGEPRVFEQGSLAMGRVFEVEALSVGLPRENRVAVLFNDVTERKRAELIVQGSARTDALRVALSDAIRPLTDPLEVQRVAAEVLGRFLGVNRALYAEIQADGEHFFIQADYSDAVSSVAGLRRLSDFGPQTVAPLFDGQAVVVSDVTLEPHLTKAERAIYADLQVRAHATVCLVRDDRLVAFLSLHQSTARAWTHEELALLEETAQRTWSAVAQARAEAALRENLRRFDALAEVVPDLIYTIDVQGRYMYGNRRLHEVLRKAPGEVVGKPLEELGYSPGLANHIRYQISKVVNTGATVRDDTPFNGADGERRYDYVFAPLPGDDGTIIGIAGVTRDITERRALEEALIESNERFAYQLALADALRDLKQPAEVIAVASGLLTSNLNATRVTYHEIDASGNWVTTADIQGGGSPSVIGKLKPLFVEQLQSGHTVSITNAASDERLTAHERVTFVDRGVRASISYPLFKGGHLTAVLRVEASTPRDWTQTQIALIAETAERSAAALERLRIEQRLQQNEGRLQRTLEAGRAGSWDYDPQTGDVIYDGIYGELFGLPTGEGRVGISAFVKLLPLDDQERAFTVVYQAMMGGPGSEFETEYRVQVPGLSERWVSSRGKVELTASGSIRLIGTVIDITERHTLELKARAALERLELALEAGGIGLWDWDLTTNQLQWSVEQERLYGLDPGTFGGSNEDFVRFIHPEDRQDSQRQLEALERGESSKQVFRIVLASGETRWIHAVSRPTLDATGRLVRVTGANLDVSESKRAQLRLIEINEAQRRFVSDAAHELRAPLTGIRGNLSLIARYPDMPVEDRLEAAQESEREVGRLTRLISDLLTAARGESREHQIIEEVKLERVLIEAWKGARALSERRRFDLGALQPCIVSGDPDALKQLALTLLENAVKYSPEDGTVRLELTAVDGWAEFRVSDTGAGIAQEDLEKVFERFYRTDRARSRLNGPAGTGLGLTIAKQIVERHGGTIHLTSQLGVGTSAIVRLPLRDSTLASPALEHQPSVAI